MTAAGSPSRAHATEPMREVLAALEPLPSSLRTPDQMRWIHGHFPIDGLARLARADRQYADEHGYYLPDVAALAHAALVALAAAVPAAREPEPPTIEASELRPGDVIDITYYGRDGWDTVRRTVVAVGDEAITLRDESDGREYAWATFDRQRIRLAARVEGSRTEPKCECPVTRQAVIRYEDEHGFNNCPVCGKGSFHHREESAPAAGAAEPKPIVSAAETHSSEAAPWGVECPCCYRRVVTTEAPCECGFRFPRGYGAKAEALANDPHEVEHALCAEVLALADDLDVADTEFCRECGVVLEACDEPPLCCRCAAEETMTEHRWSDRCPACKGYPVRHRLDASCHLNRDDEANNA